MNSIEKLEERYQSHIIFIYNNLYDIDAFINNKLVEEVYENLELLKQYKQINLVINTLGGNLTSGVRLVRLLKYLYDNYSITVFNRCSSTGTLIAMGGKTIYITPMSLITPFDPQMEISDGSNRSISSSLVRNILNNSEAKKTLDPIIYGTYKSTINNFKQICDTVFGSNATNICNYMLSKVNSHEYPMTKEEIESLGINVEYCDENMYMFLKEQHKLLTDELQSDYDNNNINTVLSVIKDRNGTKEIVKNKIIENDKCRFQKILTLKKEEIKNE